MSKLLYLLSGVVGVRPLVCALVVFDKFMLIVLKVRMWLKLAECDQSASK